jgi:aminoglycoside phosphotransferase (APT) family kinase protein
VTYLLCRDGAEVVLRRPPRPPLPPSAHDVLREAWLLRSLQDTGVRTPRVLATCDDESVIGAPFYVMEKVEGDVITSSIPEALDTPAERARIGDELVDALVELHAVDWRACGLEAYGKPTGYLDRQLRRFGGLWEINRTRELPTMERVTAWLAANRPDSGVATIVHGDYRLGNAMFAPGAPARLNAIFDWELSTIGDPLADVGYMVATWAQEGDPENMLFTLGVVTREPGFPTRDELIGRYEERSGRSMRDVRWYTTLAMWKAAIFLEGSYRRRLAGTTEDPFFDLLAEGVPQIAEHAWQTAQA